MFRYNGKKDKQLKMFTGHLYDIQQSKQYIEPFGGSFSLGFRLFQERYITSAVYNEYNPNIYAILYAVKHYVHDMVKLEPTLLQYILCDTNQAKLTVTELVEGFTQKEGVTTPHDIYITQVLCQLAFLNTNKGSVGSTAIHMNNVTHLLPYNVEEYHQYLQNTELYNDDYRTILQQYDNEQNFFYIDPPYAYEDNRNTQYYGQEQPFNQEELYNLITNIQSNWVLTNIYNNYTEKLYKDSYTKLSRKTVYGGNRCYEIWVYKKQPISLLDTILQ